MSPFSHLSLDSKTISSISFHYHSPELVHKNSNSGHFDHLPSLNYICTTETYRYKNHKTKLSEFCLHVRITQGAFKKKKKILLPQTIKSASLGWNWDYVFFEVPPGDSVMKTELRIWNYTSTVASLIQFSFSFSFSSALVSFNCWPWLSPFTKLK